jgi:hypothetical protein
MATPVPTPVPTPTTHATDPVAVLADKVAKIIGSRLGREARLKKIAKLIDQHDATKLDYEVPRRCRKK